MTVVKNYFGEVVGEYPNGLPAGMILGKGEYVDNSFNRHFKLGKNKQKSGFNPRSEEFHTGAYHIPEEWLDD